MDDIFADENDAPVNPSADVNVGKNSLSNQSNPGPVETIDYENEGLGFLGKMKKHVFKIVLLIIIFLLIGAGFVYRKQLADLSSRYVGIITTKIKSSKSEAVEESNKSVGEQNENSSLPVKNNEPANQEQDSSITVQSPEKIDSDQDGLTDSEEKSLGTNPNSVDSDSDGLFDREEVKVYKTNPLSQDTDGDSYKDGDEVKAKMNPRGPGKLNEMK